MAPPKPRRPRGGSKPKGDRAMTAAEFSKQTRERHKAAGEAIASVWAPSWCKGLIADIAEALRCPRGEEVAEAIKKILAALKKEEAKALVAALPAEQADAQPKQAPHSAP